MFKIGCDYACGVCFGTSGDDSICQPKGSVSHCGGQIGSTICAFCNCCWSCCSRIGSVIVIG